MSTFSDLGLSDALVKNIGKLGFETPTPIQAEAIPHLLKGDSDLVGLAQTGTGKTAAFGLPLIELCNTRSKTIQGLVLCPTRELCLQIHRELSNFASHRSSLSIVAVYGGADIRRQIKAIRDGAQIIIATPGRLLDLMNRKVIDLSRLKSVTLDEADEMLNMGFQEDIDSILDGTPDERSTWLFSATMPKSVERIAKRYMTDPIELSTSAKNIANRDISHQFIVVKKSDQIDLLRLFLDANPEIFGLVFCRTRRDTKEVADKLESAGYNSDALHGDLNQTQRDRVMGRFRKKKIQVLVATDVAARGIDVNDITHVFNFNIPDDLAFYTHRSGRTARAGKKGESIIFLSPREKSKLRRLENVIQAKFKQIDRPDTRKIVANQINHFLEKVFATPVHAAAEQFVKDSAALLEDLSKEEFLARILSLRFEKTLANADRQSDSRPQRKSYERESSYSDDRYDRKRKSPKKDYERKSERKFEKKSERRSEKESVDYSDGTLQKMFVNLGSMDMESKKDLVKFISDSGGIDKSDIVNVDFDKRNSYFYIDKKIGKKLSARFKGTEFEGRPLRINPDSGDFPKEKKKKSKDKKDKKRTTPKGKKRKAFGLKSKR